MKGTLQKEEWIFPDYIVHNVAADGQCAFSAIAHQLLLKKYVTSTDETSGQSIRHDILSFLSGNAELKSIIAERTRTVHVFWKFYGNMADSH